MKHALSKLVPAPWRQALRERLSERRCRRVCYSQEGEDLVLQRLFEGQASGIYVDVGAHHPFRFSNTFLLYRQGWRGINIDAMPGSMERFKRFRHRDVNLEIGVSSVPSTLEFFVFEEPALNTFDPHLARERQAMGWPLSRTVRVECLPLARILERELPHLGGDGLDLLSVDVEGLDLDVLRSNDWSRFRPRAVVVEVLDKDVSGVIDSDIGRFCKGVGYLTFAKLHHSVVFLRQ